VLAVEGLSKRFGGRVVFQGIGFSLANGDALVVTGRNGSGKTTLLKVLAGLLAPSQGRVVMPEGDRRVLIGLSALDMALYANLTVGEHFDLAAKLRGCESNAEGLCEELGIADRIDQLARELSTGMRSRLKLGLAIQASPPILLLDEPGSSLDAEGREVVARVVERQRNRGVLVLATNDPSERRFGSHELALGARS
jgi:ABC-type multidrug transport system ATPase subunit